jgi:K(+)-stimulated pyrophosphate-energized sodium pump
MVLRLSGLLGAVILLVGAFLLVNAMQLELGVFYAVLFGSVCGIVLSLLTEWYTSGPPVRRVIEASEIGSATNILAGFTAGMQSTVLPILTICGVVLVAYNYAGIYGIGVAALSLLATSATGLTFSSLSAIADTSSGVARMTFQPQSAISVTERLDVFGNTVSAIGKSFAVGASALVALALFSAYNRVAGLPALDLVNPTVVVGLLLGGALPFLITETGVSSTGKVAFRLLGETRRELRRRREGTGAVQVSVVASVSWLTLREMIVPVLVCLGSPVAVGLILGRAALGGLLAGALLTGVLLALFMIHSGSAWNNARRLVELNESPGNPATLAAATTGDLVGDPLKDVCGPSINMLVRLIAVLTLICAPLVS